MVDFPMPDGPTKAARLPARMEKAILETLTVIDSPCPPDVLATALEAAASGAEVLWLRRGGEPSCLPERFRKMGIASMAPEELSADDSRFLLRAGKSDQVPHPAEAFWMERLRIGPK